MSDADRERLPDVYFKRDYPVLLEIVRWDISGRPDSALDPRRIAQKLGRPENEVTASVGRLFHGGYIDAADASTFEGDDYMIRRATAAGLRECGAWPDSDDLAMTLRRVLEAQATQLEATDPEKGRKVREILDAAGDLGTSFMAKLAAELLKYVSGL